MPNVKCPNCGTEFFVPTKAKDGTGSTFRKSNKPKVANGNHLQLYRALTEIGEPRTIKELVIWLWEPAQRIRFMRRGLAWSNTTVRRDLTFMIHKSLGLARMTDPERRGKIGHHYEAIQTT